MTPARVLHLIGFGSQAQAWSQCLRASGWQTPVYLSRPEGPSAQKARSLGFEVLPLEALPQQARGLVAFLCPDAVIGAVYRDYLAAVPRELTLVLAHGFAAYSGDLAPARAEHELALLAPKSIGPQIWARYQAHHPHDLLAAMHASPAREAQVHALAEGLGFAPDNRVPATFEQETVGDLISEQGLLCGPTFTFLEWTVEAMREAGIPPRLIREECISELELIAGLLRRDGPASTFARISQAAQCGTVGMRETLEQSGVRHEWRERLKQVRDGRFAREFKQEKWKPKARELEDRLRALGMETEQPS